MNETSRIMYKVGFILNIIVICIFALLVIFGIITLALDNQISNYALENNISLFDRKSEVDLLGRLTLIFSLILLIYFIIIFFLAKKFKNDINKTNVTNQAPYVGLLIVGLFGSAFYLLSGVFGILSTSKLDQNYNSR